MRLIVYFLILNLSLFPVSAEGYFFEHFTAKDGLTQNSITHILQDNQGFLWLGTYHGANRYDGYSFKNYNNTMNGTSKALLGHVSTIFEDTKGNLWVGTLGNGISRLHQNSDQFSKIEYIPGFLTTGEYKRISTIFEDSHNNIWIGTWAGGLIKFNENPEQLLFEDLKNGSPDGRPSPIVKQILEDDKGILWLATNQCLISFNRSNGHVEYFPLVPDNFSSDLTGLTTGPLGNLWIGTWNAGMFQFDPQTKELKQYQYSLGKNSLSNNQITKIFYDNQGKLWIGTNGGGLNIFNLKTETFEIYKNNPQEPRSISANNISAIFKDKSNVFWIGTEFGGVNKLYPLKGQFNHINISNKQKGLISAKSILCIYKDDQDIVWMGTFGGGLLKFNETTGKITQYMHDPANTNTINHNIVRCIWRDNKNNLWIGTDGGINKYHNNRFTSYTIARKPTGSTKINNVFSIYEDISGDMWAGCYLSGLLKYDPDNDQFIYVLPGEISGKTINDNRIWSITGDKEHNLWIGTDAGSLNKYDIQKSQFQEYGKMLAENTGQSIEKIMTVYMANNEILWLGSDKGLVKFDHKSKSAKLYTVQDGLGGNAVQSITEDSKGDLWMGTINGLCWFDPRNEIFKVYDVSDGLQGSEFHVNSVFKTPHGELYFGGINGINKFFPEKIIQNLSVPNIVITNLFVSNEEVPVGPNKNGRIILEKNIINAEKVSLSRQDRMITFEFAALDFVSPAKNRYEYFLEGFDKKESGWNKIGNRHYATYTNLSPGNYVFKVRGTNNDGIQNEQGTSLKVNIELPFWYRKWLWALSFVVVLYIIWFMYKRRVLSIKRQKDALEKLVDQRTEALKKANNDLEIRNKKIEEQSVELTKQKEYLEESNALLVERQEEVEHQALKLQLQANSLEESNGLLVERERKIRKQAELLEEQAESLQENNRKLIERQEEVEHQSLKLKVQSDALQESNKLLEERERKIRHQANKLEEQAESLKSANGELEKLNATKDRFFSIIAHDLRNPINAILGFSELLSVNYDAIEDEKKLELNKIIHQSTKNVYNLLENLLQWSRSQTNRIRFEPVVFDLQGVINENIILSKGNSRKKNLEVVANFGEDSQVFADKNMTSTLLRNLLTNAIKFTKPFGKIEVSTKAVNSFVQISVADSGIGMTDEVMEKLFRIDAAHSTYGTSGEMGTGLGLIICKEFVDKQGGEIWVESEVNKGTTFTFTLPKKELISS